MRTKGEPLMQLPAQTFPVVIRGHAALPGSGPKGETCCTCIHLKLVHHSRRYWRCGLTDKSRPPGFKGDVSARDPACAKWTADPGWEAAP